MRYSISFNKEDIINIEPQYVEVFSRPVSDKYHNFIEADYYCFLVEHLANEFIEPIVEIYEKNNQPFPFRDLFLSLHEDDGQLITTFRLKPTIEYIWEEEIK